MPQATAPASGPCCPRTSWRASRRGCRRARPRTAPRRSSSSTRRAPTWTRPRCLAAALTLAGCAATPGAGPPEPPPRPAAPPAPPAAPQPLSALPGWDLDDHAAAFAAFRDSCPAARAPALAAACREARALGRLDEAQARAFFEARFSAEPASAPGRLTAYYAPVYPARRSPDAA